MTKEVYIPTEDEAYSYGEHPGTGTHPIHHGKAENAATATYGAYEVGRDLCSPTEGRSKTSREGQT